MSWVRVALLGGILVAQTALAQGEPAPTYVAMFVHFDSPASMKKADLRALERLSSRYPEVRWTYLFNPVAYVEETPLLAQTERFLRQQNAKRLGEVGMHLHAYEKYVTAAGVPFIPKPTVYDGRADAVMDTSGYSVPLNVYSREQLHTLLNYGLSLFAEHQLPRPRVFGAGFFASSLALEDELAKLGFRVHASAPPSGEEFGKSFGGSWDKLTGWEGTVHHDTSPYCVSAKSIHPGHAGPFLHGAEGPLVELPQTGKCDWMMSAKEMKEVLTKNLEKSRATGQPTIFSLVLHDFMAGKYEREFVEVFDALRAQQKALAKKGAPAALRYGTASEIRAALLQTYRCEGLLEANAR